MAEDVVLGDAASSAGAGNLGRSTLLSFAILRTSGEERMRSPSDAAGAGGGSGRRWLLQALRERSGSRCSCSCGAANDGDDGVDRVPSEPSGTLISESTPATGEGISASTLSVEISKMGSSRWTVSPTFLSHLVMVPSVMDSPICGIRTSVPGPPVVAELPCAVVAAHRRRLA